MDLSEQPKGLLKSAPDRPLANARGSVSPAESSRPLPSRDREGAVQRGFQQVPKAELHLHLEGSLEPETLLELEPSLTRAEIDARYRYADFAGFIESFIWVVSHLRAPEDYALATRRLLERLARGNVRYAEITLGAGMLLTRNRPVEDVYRAVWEESRKSSVTVRWILDAIRQLGAEHAMAVAELAAERVGQGVVGFGIGGNEALGPVEWFAEVFEFARLRGLHLAIHAGETVGPESVWGALRWGAERIGHGIRAAEDPALLACLRERDVPLEICISSNVATGAVPSLQEHPIRRIHDAGVPIVLNTDDPAMFHTTLEREYELAARQFGFTEEELRGVIRNGFRYAFAGGTDFPVCVPEAC
jgi:adenosine deaminase/aminodeoxyfutalosine deaminase